MSLCRKNIIGHATMTYLNVILIKYLLYLCDRILNKVAQHSAHIRFRRFSRKGYAAFNSLHRVIHIGNVARHIADLQLKKSNTHHQLAEYEFINVQSDYELDKKKPKESLLQLIESSFTTFTLNQYDTAAACRNYLYLFLKLSMRLHR